MAEDLDPDTMIRRLKAVVFDLDDTLLVSTVDYAKFKTLTIERLVQYGEPREDYTPSETIVAILRRFEGRMRTRGVPEVEIRRRLAELDRIMDEVEMEHVDDSVAYPDSRRLLRLLRENGVKVGILTRGCRDYAVAALSKTGLADLVDAMECRNSETRPKPDRESFDKLIGALGVRREDTVLVGDHPIDGHCASNAGVPFIGVRTGEVPDHLLVEAGAVAVFDDVGELADYMESVLKRQK